jgi:hypothetical protein
MRHAQLNSLFGSYKRDAKRKGVVFEITKDKFKEITKQDCIFCGEKPSNSHHHSGIYGSYVYNGIDRIDSQYGYSDFNCVPACKRCNQMKNDMTVREFIDQTERIMNKMR